MPETYSTTLKHDNGIDYLAPRTIADNVSMVDGRTVEVNVSEIKQELEQKADKQWMPDNWKTESDLPSAYPNKTTTIFYANNFLGFSVCIVETKIISPYMGIQTISSNSAYGGTQLKYRLVETTNWGTARTIATTEKINISDRLLNGWVVADNSYLTLTVSGKTAHISGKIKDGVRAKNTAVFTLPDGIRPSLYMVKLVYSQAATPLNVGLLRLDNNLPNVIVENNYDLASAVHYVIDFSFPII